MGLLFFDFGDDGGFRASVSAFQISKEVIHVYVYRVSSALAGLRIYADIYPALDSEVDSLCNVEAWIETAVVAPGEGDDELPFILDASKGCK